MFLVWCEELNLINQMEEYFGSDVHIFQLFYYLLHTQKRYILTKSLLLSSLRPLFPQILCLLEPFDKLNVFSFLNSSRFKMENVLHYKILRF